MFDHDIGITLQASNQCTCAHKLISVKCIDNITINLCLVDSAYKLCLLWKTGTLTKAQNAYSISTIVIQSNQGSKNLYPSDIKLYTILKNHPYIPTYKVLPNWKSIFYLFYTEYIIRLVICFADFIDCVRSVCIPIWYVWTEESTIISLNPSFFHPYCIKL